MGNQRVPWEATVRSHGLPLTSIFGLPGAGATQSYPLGMRVLDDSGFFGAWSKGAEYEYVKAGAGVAANEVMSNNVTSKNVIQSAATKAGVASRTGVSTAAISNGEYGWICKSGPCLVKYSGTGYLLGDPVAPDVAAAGKVIEHSITGGGATAAESERINGVMGFALEAEDATTSGLLKVYLNKCL